MIFATLLNIEPAMNREAYERLKVLRPPKGVSIKSLYGLLGGSDALVVLDAPDARAAMDFILTLCKVEGVRETETFTAIEL